MWYTIYVSGKLALLYSATIDRGFVLNILLLCWYNCKRQLKDQGKLKHTNLYNFIPFWKQISQKHCPVPIDRFAGNLNQYTNIQGIN